MSKHWKKFKRYVNDAKICEIRKIKNPGIQMKRTFEKGEQLKNGCIN